MKRRASIVLAVAALAFARPLRAQDAPPTTPVVTTASGAQLTLGGYLETYYAYDFNAPSNGITAERAFDDRHDTFTIENVALDSAFRADRVSGRLTLQVGQAGNSYYLSEPRAPGAPGVGATDGDAWKYIQQAYAGWNAPLGRGLLVEAGLFLSPIGPENLAIKDQWNWSRSDLFFALPYYHTGARVTYPWTDRWSTTVAAYNGWNSVVDGNDEKSISASAAYNVEDEVTWSVLYFGGNERPRGALEGKPWRHLFDTFVAWYPTKALSFMAHADGGVEKNFFGTTGWIGGALYARVQPVKWLYVAARVDRMQEQDAPGSTRLFYPGSWTESGTLTLDARPTENNLSFRVEYRHDASEAPAFFRGTVQGDGSPANPFVPNARSQDTLLVGMTAWF